ncbi:MAG: MBL fold metallo-hydrolase [Chloroflexota bacterium]|nr:MBL fold metallo-hydrolase [Chloroflexota bacterium]
MKITFLGGADEVGASCALVELAGKQLLVDAGIRISPRSSRGIQNSQLPDLQPITAIGGPDFVLVTHAHTDHTGALPLVMEQYPQAPVLATAATQALTRVLQLDAQRIMKTRQDEEGELPLFDAISVQRLLEAFQTVEFNKPVKLSENLQVTYYTAGHIAGAAVIVLESSEGVLVFSGDISKSEQRTVKSVAVPPVKADALILESTYGGRLHANRVGEEKRLIQTLRTVTERGGKVLIPAFALGRAQEVIQILLAHADELEVPVYVDGMVRAVCDAYQSFGDILPRSAARIASKNHLFFRGNIRPIRNSQERQAVALSEGPLVVVASSGMLTGGASVFYARHFAPGEANAILMTGYQDEEAPGRFLQRLMRERQRGESPTLRLGDATVKVRCEIDTYSLSAHADESELLSFAEALKADDIMLVHGDAAARHSLATALRQRGRSVATPRIGQTKTLIYRPRPWSVGGVRRGAEVDSVNLRRLWEALKTRAGDHFSLRELSQVWWGASEREDELEAALQSDKNFYFVADWRDKKSYQVKTAEQVQRSLASRAIMLANPDLVGKLIVMRNSNGQIRLAVVIGAEIDSFTAIVHQQRGTRHPGDALLWVIGDWTRERSDKSARARLSGLMKRARGLKDRLLPFSRREALVRAGKPVLPEALLPDPLPEDVDRALALIAIVLALGEDAATLETDGLLPHRALSQGPMDQNEARELAIRLLPAESRLRKVGMEIHRKRLTLTFDFPATAQRRFSGQIERLGAESGWQIQVKPTTNQLALGAVAEEIFPEGTTVKKGPAYFTDKRQVHYDLLNISERQSSELRERFREITGFDLVISNIGDAQDPAGEAALAPANVERMEINAAYGLIRARLKGCGLGKTSLKQGQIVLGFVSPQVGQRHQERINQLAEETGYNLVISPHPNQYEILRVANRLIAENNWMIAKGPGIHDDRGELRLEFAKPVPAAEIESFSEKLEAQTGFKLAVQS